MNPYKMLIVDDEWMISDSLSSMDEWKERNIEVIGTASNGEEAIKWLERESVDFMITDIHMPDMDGLQLLQYAYENKPRLQTVVISGHAEFAYARKAVNYKALGYVLKPLDMDELLAIIDDSIAKTSAAQVNLETTPAEIVPRTYHESIVQKAKAFMHSNLDKPLSLSDTAEAVHLTPHYFGQMFKTIAGETFVAYLTKIRMERACELLKNPELRHYDICTQVGYVDSHYFAKVFQKTYAMSPKEYRQTIR
ncbi:putative response regulatory protein [compost metagenome]